MNRDNNVVKVLFFARLREQLGCDKLELILPQASTVADLRQQLLAGYPQWQSALADQQLFVAVNQVIAHDHTPVENGAEVAFFPPVTGG